MKHIKVTGCHDCECRHGTMPFCFCKEVVGLSVNQQVLDKAIHPTCPLDDYVEDTKGKYYELLYCVENKYPDESRHDTAMRYIKEREASGTSIAQAEKPQ